MNSFVKKIGWITVISVFLLTVIGGLLFNSPTEKLQATESKPTTNQFVTDSLPKAAAKIEQEKNVDSLLDIQPRAAGLTLGASIYGAGSIGGVVVQGKPQMGDRTYTMEWPYSYWPDPNTNTELQQRALNSANNRGFPFQVVTDYKKVKQLLPNPIVANRSTGWTKLPLGAMVPQDSPTNLFYWPNIPPQFKNIQDYSRESTDGWAGIMFWYNAVFEGDTQYLTAEPIAQEVPVGYPSGSASTWVITEADIKNWIQNVNLVNVDNGSKIPVLSGYNVEFFDEVRTVDVSKASDDQFINVKVSYSGLSSLVSIPIKVVDKTTPAASITANSQTVPFGYPDYGDKSSWSWTPSANDLKSWVNVKNSDGSAITNYTVKLKTATTVNTGNVGTTNYTVTVTYTDSSGKEQIKDIDVPITILKAKMQVNKGTDGSFKVGEPVISADKLKEYFIGKVSVISVDEKGAQVGMLSNGLGSSYYTTALNSPIWNSTGSPNPVSYTVNVTYAGNNYKNKLENDTVTAA